MRKKIKTPLTQLIEELQSELYHERQRPGLEYAIAIAKRMLKREKSMMCWFAREWHNAKLKNQQL